MKNQIVDLINQNKLDKAIQLMKSFSEKSKEKNALNLLQSRLNETKHKITIGVLSEENANLEINKIRKSLLEVADALEKEADPVLKKKANITRAAAALGAILLLTSLFFFISKEPSCEDRRVAILVADFQNKEKDTDTDGFANSIVTRINSTLDNSIYDVSQVGTQSREVKKYDEYIRESHFESTCDTSGLFVNGFLSVEQKVFNVYITIANLVMDANEFSDKKAISLDNPSGIEFSISQDAKFISDFIVGILKSYEGKSYEALDVFFELEKSDKQGVLKKDKNIKANFAYFKGNCYAMRGDYRRANQQYDIATKNGNPELKKASRNNKVIAKEIEQKIKADPKLNKELGKRLAEHSNFEKELKKLLKKVGGKFVDFGKQFK